MPDPQTNRDINENLRVSFRGYALDEWILQRRSKAIDSTRLSPVGNTRISSLPVHLSCFAWTTKYNLYKEQCVLQPTADRGARGVIIEKRSGVLSMHLKVCKQRLLTRNAPLKKKKVNSWELHLLLIRFQLWLTFGLFYIRILFKQFAGFLPRQLIEE